MNYYQITQKPHDFKFFDQINKEFTRENYDQKIQIVGIFKGFLTRQESIKIYKKRKNQKNLFSYQLKKLPKDSKIETSSIILIQQEDLYIIVDCSNIEDLKFLKNDLHISLFGKFEFNEDDLPIFFADIIFKEDQQVDLEFLRLATKILKAEKII